MLPPAADAARTGRMIQLSKPPQSARRPLKSLELQVIEAPFMAAHQYVYHMHKLSKAYPGGKQVLKDISL